MEELEKTPEERELRDLLKRDWGIDMTPAQGSEARKKPGWVELDEDSAARVLDTLRVVPGLASNEAIRDSFAGAVRLVIPGDLPREAYFGMRPGLGEGVYGMVARDPITGRAVRQAGWAPMDLTRANLAQAAYGAFSVASVVTGQYFMKRVDQKLEGIQRVANDVKEFLELDKYCQMKAQWSFLQETFENTLLIRGNAVQRQAAVVSTQSILCSALADMLFYRERAEQREAELDPKGKGSELERLIEEIAENVTAYWFALHVYSLATVLELALTENRDRRYLAGIQGKLELEQERYQVFFGRLYGRMCQTIEAWDQDKLLFNVAKGTAKDIPIVREVLVEKVDELHRAALGKKRQEKMTLIKTKLGRCEDVEQLQSMSDSVAALDRLSHRPTELLIDGEEVYLRVEEAPETTTG